MGTRIKLEFCFIASPVALSSLNGQLPSLPFINFRFLVVTKGYSLFYIIKNIWANRREEPVISFFFWKRRTILVWVLSLRISSHVADPYLVDLKTHALSIFLTAFLIFCFNVIESLLSFFWFDLTQVGFFSLFPTCWIWKILKLGLLNCTIYLWSFIDQVGDTILSLCLIKSIKFSS